MTTSDELGGTFCHDHYEHPLLWCEEKKRLTERRNAEESMRMWRRRKAEEVARKEREKEEYYELFIKHCPWGRPGGGAPNVDVRRKDITAVGLHSTPAIGMGHRLTSLQPCRYSDYFAARKKCHDPAAIYHHHHHHGPTPPPPPPGGRVTHSVHTHVGESARPVVTICDVPVSVPGTVPSTGATNGSNGGKNGHLDIEVRYKPTAPGKGKPMLEKIVVTETDKCPLVKQAEAVAACKSPQKKKLVAKMEKPPSKEPWGKAGPGGKMWRSQKGIGNSFMKSLGWTNKEMLKDLDQDNPVTPAEKHTFRKSRPTKKMARCCDMCVCTCPAMMTSPLKPLQKKPPQPHCAPHRGQSVTTAATTSTPHTTAMSKPKPICARFVRHCDNTNTTTATATDNSATLTPGGGVELVPLLARRRANNRPISLSSTDVTKRTASHDRLSTAEDLRYLHDLNEQMSQKRRSICVAQQLERDLCNQHFETFDTFWGRPGHGAPGEVKTKLKLDNLLYGPTDCW